MIEFLTNHSKDLWIGFALILIAAQIYTLKSPKLFIIAIASGFIAIFLELELLDQDKIHHAIFLHVILSLSGILLLTPILKYFHNKKHLLTEKPIGDYAHVHSQNLTKEHFGEISWNGFIKKSIIDPREIANKFAYNEEVIISDCVESVFYVVSNKSIYLINISDRSQDENKHLEHKLN